MAILYYLWFFLLNVAVAADTDGFISPKYLSNSVPNYGGVEIWALGTIQLVAFQVNWEEYRMQLWQQSLTKESAIVSSTLVYEQTAGQDKPQSFNWTVQTYDLSLVDSPVFFFWLKGNDSSDSFTSAYFNITIPTTASGSSSVTTSTTSDIRPTATINAVLATATVSDATSSTTASEAPSATSGSAVTSSSLASLTPSTTSAIASSTPEGGLSTGATAGIAVGASVVTMGALVGLGLFLWRRRVNGKKKERGRDQMYLAPRDYSESKYLRSYPPATPRELSTDAPGYNRKPVELS